MADTRRNLLYPVLIIAVGVVLLLLAIDILPAFLADLLERSWAALLVLIGLSMLLHGRVRFGNVLAVILVAAASVGMIIYAYERQADVIVTDYAKTFDTIPLGDNIQRLNVTVETRNTQVIFVAMEDLSKAIGAEFQGSQESEVTFSANDANEPGVVDFRIIESQSGALPPLDAAGRGKLVVYLPVGIPIELQFTNERGPVTFDFRALNIPRFNVTNQSGDIDLYMPLTSVTISNVTLGKGNLLVVVEPQITLKVSGEIGNAEVNENVYEVLRGNAVESRSATDTFDFQIAVTMPNGTLTVMSAAEQMEAQEQN